MAAGGVSDLARFDLLVQALSGHAVCVLDCKGRVASWNARAEAIAGYSNAEALGRAFCDFFTGEDLAKGLPTGLLKSAAEQRHVAGEAWRIAKHGRRYRVAFEIDAVRNEKGALIGFVEIFRAAPQVEPRALADRMDALARLSGVMAHDFNNLLTAVLSRSELALRVVDGDKERLVRMIVGLRDAAQKGAAMTRGLLAFAGRQPLEPAAVGLKSQITAVAEQLRAALPDTIELVIDLQDRLPSLQVDAEQLTAALMALALNARDAMPDGGRLTISARETGVGGMACGLSGDFVAIIVADTGEGIAPDLLERVFEPFFTTRDGGLGTGLGLSQAYGFARQSGGGVILRSEPGRGSCVTLYLPALAAASDSPGERGEEQRSVLVVEDDAQVAELTDQIFRELGYRPIMARTPAEALEALTRAKVDLVFSDVVMPGGLSGFELARRIRARYPKTPILLTTGYSDALAEREVCDFPVLNKPYRLDELEAALAALQPNLARRQAEAL